MISWIVSGALILAIPLYTQFVYELVRAKAWRRVGFHGTVLLLITSAVVVLGWYGITQPTASAAKKLPSLEFLNKQNWEEERALRVQQKLFGSGTGDLGMQVIRVKFDEADYAQRKKDFDRALELYAEIERGSDVNGPFETFPSAAIRNNMAISYFEKQGDRGFKASSLFLDALKTEPKPIHQRDLIQRNIDAIDKYLNQ